MTHKIFFLLALSAVFLLSACDIGQFTQSKELDDYVISVTNDPNPILVGQNVKIYATLRSRQSGVTGCQVTVKKEHPHKGLEDAVVDMPEGGRSGIYHAKNIVFPERGDWSLVFTINCAGRQREVSFPYSVSMADTKN